ncbi:MAG: type VII toxin-antitoxin system HepT family RNase toxin [Bacillota bacterium]|jgi:uncharacterized protein YutE (UPF0331/DUF86 family)
MIKFKADQDVVLAKVAIIRRCLKRIEKVTEGDPAKLDTYDCQDIFVLNLQRAVQATIDLAVHLVAINELGMPSNIKDSFELLKRESIISSDLADRMKRMVGFRNIAVHDYQALDPEILKSILTTNLIDLVEFYEAVLRSHGDGSCGWV